MANRKKIMLSKMGITPQRYDELFAFCRQYDEKKKKLLDIYSISAAPTGDPVTGGEPGRGTENKALRAIEYSRDIDIIDRCLDEATKGYGEWLRKALFLSVCRGVRFGDLELYCKNVVFYRVRVKFYVLLDKRK